MNPQTIQSLAALFASMAAFLGGMYLVVTRPIGNSIRSLEKRIDDIALRLDRMEGRLGKIEERLTGVERKVDALELKAWR
jgi:hypothetical protein